MSRGRLMRSEAAHHETRTMHRAGYRAQMPRVCEVATSRRESGNKKVVPEVECIRTLLMLAYITIRAQQTYLNAAAEALWFHGPSNSLHG